MIRPGRIAIVIFISLLIPIVPFAVIGELPGERWLSDTDQNAILFGATGAGLLAADVVLPVPASIVGSLMGARLGFWIGWLWSWSGLVAGNMLGFAVGWLLLRRLGKDIPAVPTLLLLFVSRPVPLLAEALTITAGAAGMGFRSFLAVSLTSNGIYTAALAASGTTLLPRDWLAPGIAVPLLIPVAAWLIWRRYARAPEK